LLAQAPCSIYASSTCGRVAELRHCGRLSNLLRNKLSHGAPTARICRHFLREKFLIIRLVLSFKDLSEN